VQGHVKVRLAQPCPPPTSLASMTKVVKSWWFALMLLPSINPASANRTKVDPLLSQSLWQRFLRSRRSLPVHAEIRNHLVGIHLRLSIERPSPNERRLPTVPP
jgi:hypothetical protein